MSFARNLAFGPTVESPEITTLNLEVEQLVRALSEESGRAVGFFSRITPDAGSGWNNLIISGLPNGTRSISVWMTEWALGNVPHAGGAFFNTTSVQLFENGRKCRVRFYLDWGGSLPAACQVIYINP